MLAQYLYIIYFIAAISESSIFPVANKGKQAKKEFLFVTKRLK